MAPKAFTIVRKVGLTIAFPALVFSLPGCLTRSVGPTLPYVRPANSVPNIDPTSVQITSRMQALETEMQRLRDMIERLQASGANEREIRGLQERVALIEKHLGMESSSRSQDRSAAPGRPQPLSPEQRAGVPTAESKRAPSAAIGDEPAPIELIDVPDSAEEKAFKDAYALLRRSPDEAVRLFEEFLKKYPKSRLAPDAVYWMAEARLAQSRFDEAVLLFDRVIKEYPGCRKELNALLKQGEAFEKMGDTRSAAIVFEKLIRNHPHTAQARLAGAKLKSLPTRQ
jgi:tol-pal system protein YbgF